jgi:signal transduction histidine kinase
MSRWLELFPACELEATLAHAARLWREFTRRHCLILWTNTGTSLCFAFAGERTAGVRPEWMLRLSESHQHEGVVAGALNFNPGIQGWLNWLGANCGEHDLLVAPLAIEGVSAQGQLCCLPAGRSVPALDASGLEVTTRALWQATQFESRLRLQKLSALAELAAGAGHEINNPLGTILGRSQQLLRDERHPERRRWLATIGGQALRVRDMIGDLMLFARPMPARPESVDLVAVVRAAIAKLVGDQRPGIVVEVRIANEMCLQSDRTQTEIVVAELLRNAITALNGQGTIQIAAERTASITDPRQAVVRMSISDSGPGLSELEREHLFDPFFSGRQAGRGLGFGLSKCWQIVRAHGGSIRVADPGSAEPGAGLTLIIEWPAALSASSAPPRDTC